MICEGQNKKSNITKWLEEQFVKFNYDLNDDSAEFWINPVIKEIDTTKILVV